MKRQGHVNYISDPKTLQRLRRHPRVELIDDERAIGNSIIVTLRQGWTFDQTCDNRVAGADTVSEAGAMVLRAHKFEGPFEP